jgi:uncharacterized protein (DUF305 family)
MAMPKRVSLALVAGAMSAALLISTVYATTRMQPVSFDIQFIDMMVPHHQGAVEMAEVAQQRTEHPDFKTLLQVRTGRKALGTTLSSHCCGHLILN